MGTWFGLGVLGLGLAALSVSSCTAPHRAPEESITLPVAAPFVRTGAGFVTGRGAWRARVEHDGVIALAAQHARLELETVSLGRGISSPTRCLDVTLDGSEVHIDRGAVSERVSYEPMGVAQRWHFARSYAGMRRADQSWPGRLLYGFGSAALPALLLARVARRVLSKRRHVGRFVACLPLVALFLTVGAAGEMLGYLVGPGRSLERVE